MYWSKCNVNSNFTFSKVNVKFNLIFIIPLLTFTTKVNICKDVFSCSVYILKHGVLKDIIDYKIHVPLIYIDILINKVLHNDLCSDSMSNNYTAFNFCYSYALPNTYICVLLNKIIKCCVSIIVLVYKLVLEIKS